MHNKGNINISKYIIYPQGLLVCSVCGKEFNANDETRYIINNGYTCSWKCFRTESQKKREEMGTSEKDKKKVKN